MERWRDDLASLRRVCFDSNALIYAVEERQPYASLVNEVLRMLQAGEAEGFMSTLVEMELLVKPMQDRDSAAINRIEVFLRETPNLFSRPVDRLIARRTADVRARTKLRTVDAVIAATAVEEGCDAIIGNDSEFARLVVGVPYLYLDDYVN